MTGQFGLPGFEPPTGPPPDPNQLHTLYFMLMLPASIGDRAQRLSGELKSALGLRGPFIEPARMHLTLLAVGECLGEPPRPWLDALRFAAGHTHAGAVPLLLDRARSFRRAFVLLASRPNPALNALRNALRQSLKKVGWERTSNTRAHVTLSYERREHAELAVDPLCWTADTFCLIDSLYGRHEHRVLGEWRLHESGRNEKGPAKPAL
jgi:RNA 2',3'-cyclic 3'-phosphodiesterase